MAIIDNRTCEQSKQISINSANKRVYNSLHTLKLSCLIVNFISQDSPGYSKYFIKALFEKIDYFIDFPKMGRKVPESDDSNDRELIFQSYRIIYYISYETITIEMIIHGRS